ncbi:MAG: hypothetical protein KJO54_05385 [Gammaproteobacteria bacterium]|nr:hypothetical protein [Gammaproteobacteria bacterium]
MALLTGGTLSAIVAVMHLGCVVIGASCYRFLGAGEQMVALAESGHWYPPVITLAIAGVFIVWALYAFSAAGLIVRLPFARFVLALITSVYLIRGSAFQLLMAYFPGNSRAFWVGSSSIAFIIGLIHAVGLVQIWKRN